MCRPAPFFCMITHVTGLKEGERWTDMKIWGGGGGGGGVYIIKLAIATPLVLPMYLNGFCSLVSWLRHCSTTLDVHWFTLLFW